MRYWRDRRGMADDLMIADGEGRIVRLPVAGLRTFLVERNLAPPIGGVWLPQRYIPELLRSPQHAGGTIEHCAELLDEDRLATQPRHPPGCSCPICRLFRDVFNDSPFRSQADGGGEGPEC